MIPSTSSKYAYKFRNYEDRELYNIYNSLDQSRYKRAGAAALLLARCSTSKFHNDEFMDLAKYRCESGNVGTVIDIFIQYPELAVFANRDDKEYVRRVLLEFLEFLSKQDSSNWIDLSGQRVLIKDVIDTLQEDKGSGAVNDKNGRKDQRADQIKEVTSDQ